MKQRKRKRLFRPEPLAQHQDVVSAYRERFGVNEDHVDIVSTTFHGTPDELRRQIACVFPMDDVDWSLEEVNGKHVVLFRSRD